MTQHTVQQLAEDHRRMAASLNNLNARVAALELQQLGHDAMPGQFYPVFPNNPNHVNERTTGRGTLNRLSSLAINEETSNTSYNTPAQCPEHGCDLEESAVEHSGRSSCSSPSKPSFTGLIHFEKPPRIAQVTYPLKWSSLETKLSLEDKSITELKKLAKPNKLDLDLQIRVTDCGNSESTDDDLGFLYDPMFLEVNTGGEKSSYVVFWTDISARRRRNLSRSKEEVVAARRAEHFRVHTFTFCVTKNRWYYIGFLTFSARGMEDLWPSLSDTSKDLLASKLNDSLGGQERMEDLFERFNTNLVQTCWKLTSENLTESESFARNTLGFPDPSVGVIRGRAEKRSGTSSQRR